MSTHLGDSQRQIDTLIRAEFAAARKATGNLFLTERQLRRRVGADISRPWILVPSGSGIGAVTIVADKHDVAEIVKEFLDSWTK